jgi:hypothetical protein
VDELDRRTNDMAETEKRIWASVGDNKASFQPKPGNDGRKVLFAIPNTDSTNIL